MLLKGFALLLLIFIPLFLFSTKNQIKVPKIMYLTPTPIVTSVPSPTVLPLDTGTPALSIPTSTPIPQTSQIVTPPSESTQLSDIGLFIYPGSIVDSQASSSIALTSSDDPVQVTNWYKNKIQQIGMNTTSFITTNTNGNISNKLEASNGNQQINVNISKSSANSQVNISVTSGR